MRKLGDGSMIYGGERRSYESVMKKRAAKREGTGKNAPKPLWVGGCRFRSIRAAAEHFDVGVSAAKARRREYGDRMTVEQFKPKIGGARAIEVDGVRYDSIAEASRKTGVSASKLSRCR
jgi:hypothetical protein